jgi:amidophosphoribosyltransferase
LKALLIFNKERKGENTMSGVLGIDVNKKCWEEVIKAMELIQPRGDAWGGYATFQDNEIFREADKGKIKLLLEREGWRLKEPQRIIAHVNQSPKNPQPARIEETEMGPIALAFDGKIINRDELRKKSSYLVGSEAGIMARLVAAGKNPLEGLKNVYQNVKGPYSLVLLTTEGIFAARDVLGIRPIISSRFFGNDKIGCAVASESSCLEHIGMELIRDIRPGEIVAIEPGGFKTIERISGPGLKICGFEYGYWARPSSIIEDVWVGEVRRNAGKKLASTCPEADMVSSFPMSGNTAAEGLHQALGINYQSIYDYNTEAGGRSFLPFSSIERAKRAEDKLLILSWAIKGKRIIMVDDSIVEGNQALARIFKVKSAGAEEIHLRIETPPMKYRCPFDITPRGELLAANHTIEEMRKILGVKTLAFNTIEDFADVIISIQSEKRKAENPIKIENICLGCFTGEFPKYPDL